MKKGCKFCNTELTNQSSSEFTGIYKNMMKSGSGYLIVNGTLNKILFTLINYAIFNSICLRIFQI